MSDPVTIKDANDADVPVAADNVAGLGRVQIFKPAFGGDGAATLVSPADPMPVGGTVALDSATLAALENINATTGGLTDAQLRAAAVPVLGPLTDAQLRAAAVPVSALSLPLPTGAATEGGNLATLVARTPALGAAAAAASSPVTLSNETATGTITTQNSVPNGAATANSAVELVLNGATSIAIQTTGTYTGALSVQVTLDGSRWETITGAVVMNMLSGVAAATIASATVGVFTAPVHGALRARVTALAAVTGTATVTVRTLANPTVIYVVQPTAANLNATVAGTVTANIAAGTNRAGFVAGAGIWYDDSSTALAANASFTGASRDATVTASATAFANAGTYAKEIRLSAESDVTGTLWLEVSRDNTAWRRVKSVATAAVTGGGFYAEIVHRPSWRYWRVGYTNGATLQVRFSIGSVATAI